MTCWFHQIKHANRRTFWDNRRRRSAAAMNLMILILNLMINSRVFWHKKSFSNRIDHFYHIKDDIIQLRFHSFYMRIIDVSYFCLFRAWMWCFLYSFVFWIYLFLHLKKKKHLEQIISLITVLFTIHENDKNKCILWSYDLINQVRFKFPFNKIWLFPSLFSYFSKQ